METAVSVLGSYINDYFVLGEVWSLLEIKLKLGFRFGNARFLPERGNSFDWAEIMASNILVSPLALHCKEPLNHLDVSPDF